MLRQGNYLNAVADIGVFEHSLTTDLLNHLVFVQKVFMKVSSISGQYLWIFIDVTNLGLFYTRITVVYHTDEWD